MNQQTGLIEELIEKVEQYGKTTIELVKLKTLDKSSDVISNLISWLIVATFAVLFFLILNIGLALWIGELMGKSYYGFFVISGFYALLALVFGIFRKQLIKNPVNNSIIEQVLEEEAS
ncbi:MAG: phage holin family protein [Bacteroidia bacterium]